MGIIIPFSVFNKEFTNLGTNYWRNRVIKVAKDFKEKLNFAIAAKDEFPQDMESFGDRHTSEDLVVLVKNYAGSKFVMDEKFRCIPYKNTKMRTS